MSVFQSDKNEAVNLKEEKEMAEPKPLPSLEAMSLDEPEQDRFVKLIAGNGASDDRKDAPFEEKPKDENIKDESVKEAKVKEEKMKEEKVNQPKVENQWIVVPLKWAAKHMQLVQTSLEMEKDLTELLLPQVDNVSLKHIETYLKIHEDKETKMPKKPLETNIFKQHVEDKQDIEFVEKVWAKVENKRAEYIALMNAANSVGMVHLINLLACRMACALKNQKVEEENLRKILFPAN